MFSLFFIRRPIVACVIAILIVLGGVVSYRGLPVAQFPDLAPPVVNVTASFPGASAQVVANTVAAVIEEEVNGVDGMIYFESRSGSDGSYSLDVTFEVGTDPDLAAVLVQNRVNAALSRLPPEAQRQGVTTVKKSTSIVAVVTLEPKDEQFAQVFDDLFLANFMAINFVDRVNRIPGIGDSALFPAKNYAMRFWFDPERLSQRDLTVVDAINALQAQNVQVAAGSIGQPPVPEGQAFTYTINTLGRLESVEEFEQIILRSEDGRIVRMRDVGRVELGAQNYDTQGRLGALPAAVLMTYLAPGGNSVATATALRELVEEFRTELPVGVDATIIYDTSEFVQSAIEEVQRTLIEAFVLVLIVVLIFLGSIRSALIPLIAIPVSIIGTFLFMNLFGFGLNMPTLFGLVLAIGIVVDDSIVVVENVDRVIAEEKLKRRQATAKAMTEVIGAIFGCTLVLVSVFGPAAMLPGISGELYRQFAVTIAASTALSMIVALTLAPAMAGLIMAEHREGKKDNIFKRTFDRGFNAFAAGYARMIRFLVHPGAIWVPMAAFALAIVGIFWSFGRVPTGFVPPEDKGAVFIEFWLPDAASQERVYAVLNKANPIIEGIDGVARVAGLNGFSIINGAGTNFGLLVCTLEDWSERVPKGRDIDTILADIRRQLAVVDEGIVIAFGLPPVDGLGTGTGFELRVQDRRSVGREALAAGTMALMVGGAQNPGVTGVSSAFREGVPQLFADVDREKAMRLGVPLQSVFSTLAASLGPFYVNDFNLFDRSWRVFVQAEGDFRNEINDIGRLQVRNINGQMLPLSTVTDVRSDFGPNQVLRYNMFTAAAVSGQPAPGQSSGQGIATMAQIADEALPPGISYEWTTMAFQERQVEGQIVVVFLLSLLVVYLILAGLYENWFTPLAVILSIPLAVLGAMLGLSWRGMENNIFAQVGLVLLVGLGAKNAILIVVFAREKRIAGMSITDSAVEAAQQRIRPILMTALAFIVGVLPLVIATGAGATSRQLIGTTVFFGMIANTFLGLIFTPILWVIIQWINEKILGAPKPEEPLVPVSSPGPIPSA